MGRLEVGGVEQPGGDWAKQDVVTKRRLPGRTEPVELEQRGGAEDVEMADAVVGGSLDVGLLVVADVQQTGRGAGLALFPCRHDRPQVATVLAGAPLRRQVYGVHGDAELRQQGVEAGPGQVAVAGRDDAPSGAPGVVEGLDHEDAR